MSKIYLATQDWVNERISANSSSCIYGTLPTYSASAGTAVQIPIPSGATLFMITFVCDSVYESAYTYHQMPRIFAVPINQIQPRSNYLAANDNRPLWAVGLKDDSSDSFFYMYDPKSNLPSYQRSSIVFTKDNNKIGLYGSSVYNDSGVISYYCNALCGSKTKAVRYCAQFS